MKELKQRAIPKGCVEIVMRGSKHDEGQLSVRFVVSRRAAGEMIVYASSHQSEKSKQIKSPSPSNKEK